jgi:Fe-S-cluster containining protein
VLRHGTRARRRPGGGLRGRAAGRSFRFFLRSDDLNSITNAQKRRRARAELAPGQCLCEFCTGRCCRYFSLPIDNPESWNDYDAIRWYLAHKRTAIYVSEGQWYLLVHSGCNYLTHDNRCGIYLNRPKICREYTTDSCEYDNDTLFEKLFETPEQLWEYAEAVLPRRRKRRADPGPSLPIVTIS